MFTSEQRFQRMHDYANARGYVGAFPNFFDSNFEVKNNAGNTLIRIEEYGGVFLFAQNDVFEVKDIPVNELASNAGQRLSNRFRAMHDWAGDHGDDEFAYPNFHQGRNADGVVVYGAVCIKPTSGITFKHVPRSELEEDAPGVSDVNRFKAIHNWAKRNGFITGYLIFIQGQIIWGPFFSLVKI